ncbi:hypothetical protein SDC9_141211 [bioreactor metagenome]|uniref:Uncharacterized protein n=1 Tax=bioreactor metagenome TaxID=1076179 RepID=A0A645DY58_9ZZZZ
MNNSGSFVCFRNRIENIEIPVNRPNDDQVVMGVSQRIQNFRTFSLENIRFLHTDLL